MVLKACTAHHQRISRMARAFLIGSCAITTGACEGSRGGAVTVTDSAGVKLTITDGPVRTFATIDSVPLLSLGGPNATGSTLFANIRGIHVDSGRRIWVADGQSGEVRIFLRDGTHWKTVGRLGDGPGEFRRIRLVGALRSGDVIYYDDAGHRLTFFDSAGTVTRMVNMTSNGNVLPRVHNVFPDGRLLARESPQIQAAALSPGALLRDSVILLRIDTAGAREPWGFASGPVWQWTGQFQAPVAFTINASYDQDGNQTHVVSGTESRVAVWENGRLVERYGVRRAGRDVMSAHIQAYDGYLRNVMGSSPALQAYLATVNHPERPVQLPAYQQLVVSADRQVWALVYEPDATAARVWDVFDQQREWLGQVVTPPGFTISEIRDGEITGTWRDETGVEFVRVYRVAPT